MMTTLRIRELGQAQGLDISKLARKANLAMGTARALWHDDITQLDRKVLDRVALALGVKVSDLFAGDPIPQDSK